MAPCDIPDEEGEEVQVSQLEKSWLYSFGTRKVLLWTLSLGEQQGTPTTVLKHEVVWMLVFVIPQEKCLKCDSITTLAAQKGAPEMPWQIWMYSVAEFSLQSYRRTIILSPIWSIEKNPARTLLGQRRDTEEHRGPLGAEERQEPLQDRNTYSCSLTEDVKYEDCTEI